MNQEDTCHSESDYQDLITELSVHRHELAMQNEELCRTQEDLATALRKYAALYDFAPIGYFTFDAQGLIQDTNILGAHLLRSMKRNLIGMPFILYAVKEDRDVFIGHLRSLRESTTGQSCEIRLQGERSRFVYVLLQSVPVSDKLDNNAYCRTAVTDITTLKQAEEERETSVEFLRLINASANTEELIHGATDFFQLKSGCEAVGIRLRHEYDYPYFETRGFSREFVLLESRLCARNKEDRPILDGTGNPVLECMCGNVIRGRFDPSKPFFTAKGSFWSNGTTELLASTTDADRQARTRNRCNGEGYESVALFALRSGEDVFGLLQLNDKRTGRFTPETIALWERLADYLAIALSKFEAEDEIKLLNEHLTRQVTELDIAHKGKETLLKELYHRTKNNMSFISGLIDLQTSGMPEGAELRMFRELRNRIKSMALVHERLYKSRDLSNVNLRDYVADLTDALLTGYKIRQDKVSLKMDISECSLSIDTITPLGLALNELVTNSLKYAFPDDRVGEITIEGSVSGEGEIKLVYADNGIGFPEGFDFNKAQTLGLRLVNRLIKGQLKGNVEILTRPGAVFTVTFREPHYRKRI